MDTSEFQEIIISCLVVLGVIFFKLQGSIFS